MSKWSKALYRKAGGKEIFLFVSGKAYKLVIVDSDGAIAKIYRDADKALAHFESITN